MYTCLDGQLMEAEEIRLVVNKYNNIIYAIFPNGISASLRVINGQICVTNPYQNNIAIMQISNT